MPESGFVRVINLRQSSFLIERSVGRLDAERRFLRENYM
jgi:hypothetical protein